MRYLCLVYIDPGLGDASSKEEWAKIDRQAFAFNEELKRTGHYITSNALVDPKTATTVRSRGGKLLATDGPFAETKEHLGGFFLIEAKDQAEAVEIAGRSPLTRVGSVEVRLTTGF